MKKKLSLIPFITTFILLAKVTDTSDTAPTPLTYDEIEKIIFNWSRTFAQTLQLSGQRHCNPANIEQAMIKSIDTFCYTLDPHSSFLDPKAYRSMIEATNGEFCGVGIIIDNTRKSKDRFLLVADTIPDGPADKAGLKALDKIVDVDGKPLEGLTTEEITALLKGARNSTVKVKILRENQQDLIEFIIPRDLIKEHNLLSFQIKDHDIYYLALSMFCENAARQVEQLLIGANTRPCRGLILDLRNNSGGLLTSAIDIAGLFGPKNSTVVITKDRNNNETERHLTKRAPVANVSIPIFIMINNYTASAAEILAGYLKTYSENAQHTPGAAPLVFLIGTPTFGKGSVQEIIPIGNNCALKLTTQLYYLPDSTTVQGTGIEPDFYIERMLPQTEHMQWITKNYGHEHTLENFIKPPCYQKTKEKPSTPAINDQKKTSKERLAQRAQQMLERDNQLQQAITLIDMIYAIKQKSPELVTSRKKVLEFLGSAFARQQSLTAQEVAT